MAYFEIASTVIQKKREDGTTRNYKVIFERNLVSDPGTDYEVPVIDEILITRGSAGNEVNKPINPTVLSMNLRGAPSSNPLLAALKKASPEEFKIKVEDSVSGFEWFYGKLTPEISKFDMYRKVKYFNVKAICGLADTADDDQTEAAFKTPDQLLESVHTSLGISRDNEFLVKLYHTGQTASTVFPTQLQLPAAEGMNVAGITGDDLKVYNELEGFCRAFGLRAFISEGRLKLVELHEQAFNCAAANRFLESAGSYTHSTTDLQVAVDESNAIRDGQYQQKQFVKEFAHQLQYGSHKPAGTVTEADGGLATSANPEENFGNGYIAKTGDVVICKEIKFTLSFNNGSFIGELEGVGLYVDNDLGDNVYWDFVNKEWVTQENWYTLLNVSHPFAEAWTDDFTIAGFSSQPLPEGVVGELKFVALHQVNSVSEGDASYFESNEITDLDMQVQQETLKNSPVYRRWSGAPDETTGRRLAQVITIGDADEFTEDGVKYSTGGPFSQTTEWVDSDGNGRLGVVASRRLSKVLAGQKTEYRFEKRDLDFIDLASVVRVTDDEGQVSTAVLTEVKHRLLAGYYQLTAVTIGDQLTTETQVYAQAEVDSNSGGASNAGSSSSGGPGGSSGSSIDAILANINALATDPVEVTNPQINSDFTIGLKYGAGLELDGTGNLVTNTDVQDELVTGVIDNYLSIDALWDQKVSKGQFLQMVAGDGISVDDESERLLDENLAWSISVNYDTGNLKMTGGALNTIQDIDTGADVQFNSLQLGSQFDLGDVRITDGILEALTGNLTLRALNGDIIFNGDTIQADHEITTADTIIKLNDEEPGNGVTAGFSGLQIYRGGGGSWPDYLFGFRESDDQLVLGQFVDAGGGIPDPSGLQALLTRQNSPTDTGMFYYNASQKRADTSANLLFDGVKQTVTNSWYMETPSFAGGFTGGGLQIKRVDSLWRLEIDDAFFRGAVYLNELIVNQISSLNGSEILSPGRGKVEEISGVAPGETVKVSDPQGGNYASFVANDIVLCQQVRPNDNQLVKRVVRKVASVSGNDVTLTSLSGAPADSGSIIPGDLIVAIGNTTDTTRQAVLYRSVTDSAGPFGRIKTSIDSWSAWTSTDNIPFQYGYMDNLSFNGVNLTGYGAFFEDNLYVRLAGGLAHFGKGADGDGNDGLYFDANNYWTTAGFKATVGNKDLLESFDELRTTVIDEYLANQGAFSQINAINGRILLRVANVDEYIDQAVLDLKTTMIEQFLQVDGAFSGIQYLAGQLTLKVTDAGKIALVRLDATGEESVIDIAADQINIDGTTTFSSGYDPSTKETPLGAQAKVNSLQNDLDAILDDAVANGTTIISGGYIQTSFIDVDDLWAQNATITSQLTLGSGAEFTADGIRIAGLESTIWSSLADNTLHIQVYDDTGTDYIARYGIKKDDNNYIYNWINTGNGTWGIQGRKSGDTIFQLGSTNKVAGANFDVNRLWNYNADGGLELNWNSKFLKMYEGNQSLTRISILGDDWTLKTSADIRDSITNGTAFQAAIDIVDHELITGSITVKENNSGGSGPYSATLQYQRFNGSTWSTFETESLNAFGQDSITRTFRFSGMTGFSQFRIAISASSGSWSCTDYDVKQYKSEIIMNNRGLNFIGAGLFFHDLIQGLGNNFDIEQGQAFLDGDGSGNYYLKVKG